MIEINLSNRHRPIEDVAEQPYHDTSLPDFSLALLGALMLRFDRLVRLGTAPAARWLAAAVVAALLAGPAAAQDSKISVTCSPTAVDGKAKCELRTNEATTIKQVKVSIKGGGEALDAKLEPFNYRNQGIDILFMIQRMDPDHAKVVTQMGEAAIKLAGEREGKRRFGAAAFANDLDVVAPLSSARSNFRAASGASRREAPQPSCTS